MGGLMAHAALLRKPDTFGAAIIFSPSYWFSPAIAEETKRTSLARGQRVYVYAGGKESESMLPQARAMFERFKPIVATNPGKLLVEVPEGEHNEAAWRAVLPNALCWRFDPACHTPRLH